MYIHNQIVVDVSITMLDTEHTYSMYMLHTCTYHGSRWKSSIASGLVGWNATRGCNVGVANSEWDWVEIWECAFEAPSWEKLEPSRCSVNQRYWKAQSRAERLDKWIWGRTLHLPNQVTGNSNRWRYVLNSAHLTYYDVTHVVCDVIHVISFQELDQLLRCPICFEYYKTAMMFPQCSHNCMSIMQICEEAHINFCILK